MGTNVALQVLEGRLPRTLETLHVSLLGCRDVSDDGVRVFAQQLSTLTRLQDFQLDCSMCTDVSADSIRALADHLPESVNKCRVLLKGTNANCIVHNVRELRAESCKTASVRDLASRVLPSALARNTSGSALLASSRSQSGSICAKGHCRRRPPQPYEPASGF